MYTSAHGACLSYAAHAAAVPVDMLSIHSAPADHLLSCSSIPVLAYVGELPLLPASCHAGCARDHEGGGSVTPDRLGLTGACSHG